MAQQAGSNTLPSRNRSSLLDQNQALLACRPAYIPMPVPIMLTRKAANVPATAPMDQPIHPPIVAPESARSLDMCVGIVGRGGMDWLVGDRRLIGVLPRVESREPAVPVRWKDDCRPWQGTGGSAIERDALALPAWHGRQKLAACID